MAVIKQIEDPMIESDPLDALDDGMDVENDVDMCLNLKNIEDIKMSTDFVTRKRYEDGQETTSYAT